MSVCDDESCNMTSRTTCCVLLHVAMQVQHSMHVYPYAILCVVAAIVVAAAAAPTAVGLRVGVNYILVAFNLFGKLFLVFRFTQLC